VPPPQQPRHTPLDPGPRPGQPPTRNEATTSNTGWLFVKENKSGVNYFKKGLMIPKG
jgi:hypothetical protein